MCEPRTEVPYSLVMRMRIGNSVELSYQIASPHLQWAMAVEIVVHEGDPRKQKWREAAKELGPDG